MIQEKARSLFIDCSIIPPFEGDGAETERLCGIFPPSLPVNILLCARLGAQRSLCLPASGGVLVRDVAKFVSRQKNSCRETLSATYERTPWTHNAVISKPDLPSLQRSSVCAAVCLRPSCTILSLHLPQFQIELGGCSGDPLIF